MPDSGDCVASYISDKPQRTNDWPTCLSMGRSAEGIKRPIVVKPSPKFRIDLPGKLLDGLPRTSMQLPSSDLVPDFLRRLLRNGWIETTKDLLSPTVRLPRPTREILDRLPIQACRPLIALHPYIGFPNFLSRNTKRFGFILQAPPLAGWPHRCRLTTHTPFAPSTFTDFIATTGCSAPWRRIRTLALVVHATCGFSVRVRRLFGTWEPSVPMLRNGDSLRSSSRMSPDPVLPGLFLPCSLPQLLPAAAGGGLEPSPVRRFRGAHPHRLLSYANKRRLSPPLLLMAHSEHQLQPQLYLAHRRIRSQRRDPSE
jgi:hypothetical protein